MSTPAQISANRQNARKSTGPRSVEGKDSSRFNALKHGIDARSLVIPGEDPAELAALAEDYHRQCQPVGPIEAHLVDILIRSDWQGRRYDRVEAQLINQSLDPTLSPEAGLTFLFAEAAKNHPLQHLFRRRQAAQRDWFQAFRELQRLQKARRQAEPTADEEETVGEIPAIGFDLSKTPAVVPTAPAQPVPAPKIAS
ncbi:MAG TPA: hypothetical protein VLY04_01240 [Bryobacteraceae bacterium]|nr:hypothetical protein [Bryobacteraceae bacterium]